MTASSRSPCYAALFAALIGCATPPPCAPVRVAPTPITKTDYDECSGPSAVVRYARETSDTLLRADRVIKGPHTALCLPSAIAVGPSGELYVLNHAPWRSSVAPNTERWMSWVTVYDSSASEDAAPVRTLHLQPRDIRKPISLGVDAEGYLYVGYGRDQRQDSGSIAVFAAGTTGDVPPVRVIHGFGNGMRKPGGLAVDRWGYLYVTNSPERSGDDAIRVFDSEAEGDAAACRVIAGPHTGLHRPAALALDRKDRLYVANAERSSANSENAVTVYDTWASGDAAPLRTIAGGNRYDGMSWPTRLLLDSRDSLYVRSSTTLAVYAPEVSGALEPARYIFTLRAADVPKPSGVRIEEAKPQKSRVEQSTPSGRRDELVERMLARVQESEPRYYRNRPPAPEIFAVDRHDTLYVAAGDAVLVYAPGYTGTEAPLRRIAGPRTGIQSVSGLAVDHRGWVYVAVRSRSVVVAFPPGAEGDVSPGRTIGGSRTGLRFPASLALDRAGRLYVANGWRLDEPGAVAVHAPGARGEDQPVRVLAGPSTGLVEPADIEFDGEGNMYVPSGMDPASIGVFRREAAGDEAPLRTIVELQAGSGRPVALAFGRADTLYSLRVSAYYRKCDSSAERDSASVATYPPGAAGETAPVRTLSLKRDCESPGRRYALGTMQALAADTAGGVRIWHPGGSIVSAPGDGAASPISTMDENPVPASEATGIGITSDGRVYRTFAPPDPSRP